MSGILDKALIWAERQLPDGKSLWITDLRYEANHIPGSLARQRFLWSGILAALGQVLRVRVGVQQVGQTLLGLAILAFCLGGLIVAPNIETAVVKQTFYTILRGRDYVSLSRDYGEPHAFAPSFSGAGNFYDIGFTKSI